MVHVNLNVVASKLHEMMGDNIKNGKTRGNYVLLQYINAINRLSHDTRNGSDFRNENEIMNTICNELSKKYPITPIRVAVRFVINHPEYLPLQRIYSDNNKQRDRERERNGNLSECAMNILKIISVAVIDDSFRFCDITSLYPFIFNKNISNKGAVKKQLEKHNILGDVGRGKCIKLPNYRKYINKIEINATETQNILNIIAKTNEKNRKTKKRKSESPHIIILGHNDNDNEENKKQEEPVNFTENDWDRLLREDRNLYEQRVCIDKDRIDQLIGNIWNAELIYYAYDGDCIIKSILDHEHKWDPHFHAPIYRTLVRKKIIKFIWNNQHLFHIKIDKKELKKYLENGVLLDQIHLIAYFYLMRQNMVFIEYAGPKLDGFDQKIFYKQEYESNGILFAEFSSRKISKEGTVGHVNGIRMPPSRYRLPKEKMIGNDIIYYIPAEQNTNRTDSSLTGCICGSQRLCNWAKINYSIKSKEEMEQQFNHNNNNLNESQYTDDTIDPDPIINTNQHNNDDSNDCGKSNHSYKLERDADTQKPMFLFCYKCGDIKNL